MVITEQWIRQHASDRGGWTKKQLAAIDVTWPPASGWITRAVGREITQFQQCVFDRRATPPRYDAAAINLLNTIEQD